MSVFSCKDTVNLSCESLDCSLPLGRRLALHFHLLMCRDCARFRSQLLFLNEAAHRFVEEAAQREAEQSRLSAEARDRMKSALEQNNS
jgi:hypothetical protein